MKSHKGAPHRIEVSVDRIEQLFNSMDPSPFHEKDLDQDAEEFIVSWAQEFPLREPVSLVVHVNQIHANGQELVEAAVHHYFGHRAKLSRLEFHHLLKLGRLSLIIGLAFLGTCLLGEQIFLRNPQSTLSILLRQSLVIAGWVAMWRPMQIFLYDWWPLRRTGRLYEKLSRIHVEVKERTG